VQLIKVSAIISISFTAFFSEFAVDETLLTLCIILPIVYGLMRVIRDRKEEILFKKLSLGGGVSAFKEHAELEHALLLTMRYLLEKDNHIVHNKIANLLLNDEQEKLGDFQSSSFFTLITKLTALQETLEHT
jgi:hypothetical protein